MAQQVPDGSIVTYQGKWNIPFARNKADVMREVSQRLTESGIVLNNYKQLDWTLFGSISVELTLFIHNGGGFATVEDVASIVNNGVYRAIGVLPTSYSIPSIKKPGAILPTNTGQTDTTPSGEKPKSWWEQFVSKLETLSIGGILGVAAVSLVLLLAFGLFTAKRVSPV